MCLPILAAATVLTLSAVAMADTPAPAAKKVTKPIRFDGITIHGKREVPLAVVLTRDDSVKEAMDSSVDQHVAESMQQGR